MRTYSQAQAGAQAQAGGSGLAGFAATRSISFAWIAVLVVLAPVMAACGDGDDGGGNGSRGIVFDTVDGVVTVSNAAGGGWSNAESWRLEEVVRIGALEGVAGDPRVFGDIVGVAVSDDGGIYVADSQANEIRVFDSGGAFVRRFGRAGEGPGEFRRLDGLAITPEGEVAALDAGRSLLQVFDLNGDWLRQYRLQRPYIMIRGGAPLAFDTASRFYDRLDISSGILQDTIAYMVYRGDGALRDTIRLFGHEPETVMALNEAGLPMLTMSVPYTAHSSTAVSPRGTMIWTLGDSYRIEVVANDGTTARVVERAYEPVPIPAATRDSALDVLRARFLESSGQPLQDDPELPDHLPAILRLEVDDYGNIWARRNTFEAAPKWDVFDPEGRYLGSLDIAGMRLFQLGRGFMAGVEYGEFDEEYVRVMRVVRN